MATCATRVTRSAWARRCPVPASPRTPAIDAWIRPRRFEREERARQAPPRPDPVTDARLARIEQVVEVTSLEVERIAESQRYVAPAERQPGAIGPVRSPERAVTPH